MKALVQRVASASVTVDGEVVGAIGEGFLVLLGVEQGDTDAQSTALAAKVAKLRVFPDDKKPMNRSVLDVGGAVLVVSQFTLAADHSRGNRPSFVRAAEPALAERLYQVFVDAVGSQGVPVETGVFGAMMDVSLVNRGPATFVLEAHSEATRPV